MCVFFAVFSFLKNSRLNVHDALELELDVLELGILVVVVVVVVLEVAGRLYCVSRVVVKVFAGSTFGKNVGKSSTPLNSRGRALVGWITGWGDLLLSGR